MSKFQELKYDENRKDEYERLKDKVFIQNNFNTGVWKDALNLDKQARHMQSTVEPGKSYFDDDVDVKALYRKYKMTGKIKKLKGRTNLELIDFMGDDADGIDVYTGHKINGMTIHYSKTGAYLIPTYHRKDNV